MTDIPEMPSARVPTPARIYDYMLGGKDNFEVDRVAARGLMSVLGEDLARGAAWENRRFLWRVVEYLAKERGIDQFIDVGSGLPTNRNTHEIAQEAIPGARVVYVDNDPIVMSHGRALLAKDGGTSVIIADARRPQEILDHPDVRELIDFSRPVAVLFVAVLYLLPSRKHPRYQAGDADPWEAVAAFRDRVAPGSYLAVSHFTATDEILDQGSARVAVMEETFDHATAPMTFRSREEIAGFFDGWRLVEPGLVRPWEWRPGPHESPRTGAFWAGVGVKD